MSIIHNYIQSILLLTTVNSCFLESQIPCILPLIFCSCFYNFFTQIMHFHFWKYSNYRWEKWSSVCCSFWTYRMAYRTDMSKSYSNKLSSEWIPRVSTDLAKLLYCLILSSDNSDTPRFSSAFGIMKDMLNNVKSWSGVHNVSKLLTNQWCYTAYRYSIEEKTSFLDKREFTYQCDKEERTIASRHIVKGCPGIIPSGFCVSRKKQSAICMPRYECKFSCWIL